MSHTANTAGTRFLCFSVRRPGSATGSVSKDKSATPWGKVCSQPLYGGKENCHQVIRKVKVGIVITSPQAPDIPSDLCKWVLNGCDCCPSRPLA